MRAPQHREPTLRRHPRLRRFPSRNHMLNPHLSDETMITRYEHLDNKSLSTFINVTSHQNQSTQSIDGSIDSRGSNTVPRLSKLARDIIKPANLEYKRTDLTDLFDARHHHDHHDSTQHKVVYIRYQPKVPKFQLPPVKKTKAQRERPFQKAVPSTAKRQSVNEDWTVPIVRLTVDKEANLTSHDTKTRKKNLNRKVCPLPSDHPFRSRKDIKTVKGKAKFYERIRKSQGVRSDEHKWFIDKTKYIKQLREELDSIKSCNTSKSSSQCSNYTNDSGSYLELEGTKVACDYIVKPNVPFEEIDRCRVTAKSLQQNDEYYGPYYHVPFSGQKMDMRQLSLPKDKFFTSSVRSRYGVRNRLQVNVPDFESDLIGRKETKFISQLATEWDNYYQNEIKNRPRVRKFQPRTILAQARNALRKQFLTLHIQEAITEHAIIRKKEQLYAEEVERFHEISQPLFTEWEATSYRQYMRKMQEVKPYFEKTDSLRKKLTSTLNIFIREDMQVIYLEGDWRTRTQLQNFHYLLKEQSWRMEFDWIHRREDGEMENYRESIKKRDTVNLRKMGGKDSASLVQKFYDEFFKDEKARTIHIVFPTSESFRQGVVKLKMKSFMCLLELHFSMWVLSNVEHAFNSFCKWSGDYIAKRQKFVKARCSKKYFNEDLATSLQNEAMIMIGEPLYAAISDRKLRELMALCETLFMNKVPMNIRDNMKTDADMVDKFTVIVNYVMEMLGKFIS